MYIVHIFMYNIYIYMCVYARDDDSDGGDCEDADDDNDFYVAGELIAPWCRRQPCNSINCILATARRGFACSSLEM